LRAELSESKLAGLTLDAERGLLYYSDNVQGVIAEITTSGSNRREIYSEPGKRPQAIAVDPSNRWRNRSQFAVQFWRGRQSEKCIRVKNISQNEAVFKHVKYRLFVKLCEQDCS